MPMAMSVLGCIGHLVSGSGLFFYILSPDHCTCSFVCHLRSIRSIGTRLQLSALKHVREKCLGQGQQEKQVRVETRLSERQAAVISKRHALTIVPRRSLSTTTRNYGYVMLSQLAKE